MLYLDLAMRGGAATVLILLAVLLWRAPIGFEGRLSLVAVALAETAFLIVKSATPLDIPDPFLGGLILLASLSPNAVTWLILTIFLDRPRRRWPWFVASSIVSASIYLNQTQPELGVPCLPMAAALYFALLVMALWTARDDMVECRCNARPGFAVAISGLSFGLTASEFLGVFQSGSQAQALIHSGSILAVAVAFAGWILRPDLQLWPGPADARTSTPDPDDAPLDHALIRQIQISMDNNIWREEGLTIAALAHHLHVPEHRVRRAINQGLGYRNFSSFINHARITAARQQLGDPHLLGKTILEIAYDVGFASLGPFNRAFRAETDQSPSEYRRAAQATPRADVYKSQPMLAKHS